MLCFCLLKCIVVQAWCKYIIVFYICALLYNLTIRLFDVFLYGTHTGIARRPFNHIFPPLHIARRLFIQPSEPRRCGENENDQASKWQQNGFEPGLHRFRVRHGIAELLCSHCVVVQRKLHKQTTVDTLSLRVTQKAVEISWEINYTSHDTATNGDRLTH